MTDNGADQPAELRPRKAVSPTSRARRIGGRVVTTTPDRDKPDERIDGGGSAHDGQDEAPASRPAPIKARRARAAETSEGADPVGGPDDRSPSEDDADAGRDHNRLLRWLPASVLAVAALVLVVFVLVASHGVYWARPDDSAGARSARQQEVLAAAKQCYAQINTYDYRKLDGLVSNDVKCTTGKFTADLTKAVNKSIIAYAPKEKATQTAQVNEAGIVSVSPDGNQVVTLLYGQLMATNTTVTNGPRIDIFGAVVTMTRVKGSWLISQAATDVGSGS